MDGARPCRLQVVIMALSSNPFVFISHSGKKQKCAICKKAQLRRKTERVGLHVLDQDIDSDILPPACPRVVYAGYSFDKLTGVGFIDGSAQQFLRALRNYFPCDFIAACAAANLAIGTRKGEQET